MKVTTVYFICAAALVALLSCQAAPVRADGVRSAIETANAEFSAGAAKRDGATLAALYASDGQVLPPGSDVVRGTEAIKKFWQGAFDSGIAGIGLKTVEVFAEGKTATEVGQYELRDTAGNAVDHGKYIVIWRREGDKWKLFRDMFSSSVPPPQSSP